MITISELQEKTKDELAELAKTQGVSGISGMKKHELVIRLLQAQAVQQGFDFASGIMELTDEGYAFLRQESLLPGSDDVYVSQSQIRRFGLRSGDMVSGQVRPPKNGEKYFSLIRVEAVNGVDPEMAKSRPSFGSLTPIFADKRINLEIPGGSLSTRLVDLIAPVGRGQRD
jgi:transcription termination factor Rho